MPNIKLPKLPERVPVKIAIAINPDPHRALQAYAALYCQTYGEEEELATLIPSMLKQFLASDRAFTKAQRTPSNTRIKS